jgi:uncharacterized protein (DUF302 family)
MSAVGRSNLMYGLGGISLGALIAFVIFVPTVRRTIIQERQSPYDFSTTVETIRTNAASLGWTVSRVEDFQEVLAQTRNPAMSHLQVIELCHAGYASEMLECRKSSCVAMMPCAIAVYEQDGHVYVASLNRGLIGRLFRREAATVMGKVRADEREILRFTAAN